MTHDTFQFLFVDGNIKPTALDIELSGQLNDFVRFISNKIKVRDNLFVRHKSFCL